AGYMGEELARCREALSESQSGKSLSVKRLERRIAQLEETYQRLMAAENKDDGVHWTETGVDYIFCDEGHLYKNRRVDSAIEGMANPGSQRAQDLDAKLWALRHANSPRVVTFATATPVANSIAELWTMQSYLQPDTLAEVELAPFDSWAATFGRTVTALELAPDGGSYRMKTRFARFQNIPELLTLYRQVADVRTTEDLNLPVPVLRGGGPETVIVPASPTLREYVSELAARAERVRSRSVAPDEDNMLKITGDGRRAALDLRLVGEQPDPDGGKLAAAADRITAIYQSSAGHRYLDEAGDPHPRPGGVQLVFCDASTPSGKGWNAYEELRTMLTERGVAPESVRFIHEAGTDDAKAKLFAACRDGRVAVLVGSTDKMGIGTNVQARAIGLHHLDCPWRPADIEQRDGRIVRQGNQNAEVSILRYATEGSFDIYMWQTVERKAAFINQVATGRAVDRDVDDIGDQALSYAEVKALATGNPLILEKASVDADVARLGRLRRAHLDDQHRLRRALDTAESRLGSAGRRIGLLESAIDRRQDTRGDRFRMTVDGVPHGKRVDAGDHLQRLVSSLVKEPSSRPEGTPVAHLAGFDIHAGVDHRFDEVSLTIPQAGAEVRCPTNEWPAVDPSSLVQRLERRIQNLDSALTEARGDQTTSGQEAERARARIGAPFEHEVSLRRLQRRQQEITEQLVPPAEEPPSVVPEASTADRMAAHLASLGRSAAVQTSSPARL
ncbi:MAG: helicase, partial [Actinomycetota bacterium]|nr:helicase [Actinomycetota bacterium]